MIGAERGGRVSADASAGAASPASPASGSACPAAGGRASLGIGDPRAARAVRPERCGADLVRTHCLVVAAVADAAAHPASAALDAGLVHAGCLLHDIGVYRLYDAEGRLDGANYLAARHAR